MGRRFLVETNFKAVDNMTPAMRRINTGFGRFAANITDKNSLLGRSFTRVNQGINRVARIGLIALTAAAGLAAREYVNLENSIVQAGAKFKDLDVTSQNYSQTLNELSRAARDVGSDTEFSATDAAGALDKMAMAGMTSAQSMALLRGTTNLATAANTDLTTAVDIATDSLGAFNLVTDDTVQLEANLARVSDVMARTTTTANTSLEEMFESVKAGAPAFTAAGQSVETFSTFTGILANSGIKGAMAGTSLRNVMLRLAGPTSEAAAIMESLGVQTQDSQGNFRDAIDIIADFEKGLEGMGTAQRTAALTTVFGARSVTGMNILLQEGSDSLRAYRDDLLNSSGAAQTMADAMRTSLSSQLKILKSGAIELGLQFIEAFDTDGRGALKGLIDLVQNIDITPLIKFAKVITAVLGFLGRHWRLILSVVGAIKALAIAIGILNLVTEIFGITLAATPIGWILTAVVALTFAIIWMALNWDKVTEALRKAWEWFSTVGQKLMFLLGPIGSFISVLIEIAKRWDDISTAFQEGGFIAGIDAIGRAITAGLIAPIKGFFEMMGKIPGVSDTFNGFVNGLKMVGRAVIDMMISPIQGFLELVSKIPGVGNLAAGGAAKIQELKDNLGITSDGLSAPETPTPGIPQGGEFNGSGNLNVNFNNLPDNATIDQSNRMPSGVNINIAPSVSM